MRAGLNEPIKNQNPKNSKLEPRVTVTLRPVSFPRDGAKWTPLLTTSGICTSFPSDVWNLWEGFPNHSGGESPGRGFLIPRRVLQISRFAVFVQSERHIFPCYSTKQQMFFQWRPPVYFVSVEKTNKRPIIEQVCKKKNPKLFKNDNHFLFPHTYLPIFNFFLQISCTQRKIITIEYYS